MTFFLIKGGILLGGIGFQSMVFILKVICYGGLMNKLKRKKILFYTDTPLLGGAENQMLLLARFLDEEKYEVVLAASNYESVDPWVREWGLEGFKTYSLRVAHKHDPRHLGQLKKVIEKEKPDVLHLHLWNPGACRYGYLAAGKDLPIVTTEHDPFELKGLKDKLKKKSNRRVAAAIAISEENKSLVESVWPELKGRVNLIHNGIDTTWFESQFLAMTEDERQEVREKKFGVSDDEKVVLTVATLHPRKGLNYLIEAAGMFGDSMVKFVIVGSGPQEKELKNLVRKSGLEDRVVFLGQQKSVARFFKASDVFVLPSLKEAFGLVLLEAMIAGLPVVATESGGVPDIVKQGETGLLVGARDALGLKQAVERVVLDKKLAGRLGEAGKKRVKEMFDAKVMAEKTAAVYERVLVG